VTLQFSNTLTRSVEEFRPLEPGKVSIYCCGVTVYDLCHLGHARSYINWDVLRRYLIWSGYAVTFVQNYTDIDDKILGRAAEEGSSMEAVSERNIEAFVADMARLNILPADRMPRATQSLGAIRALIQELEAKGAAYSADGDVYFAVMKHTGYGKLSGRDLAEQQDNASGRVASEEEARKQNPFDFALWKGAKPGEPSFESPWGPGRPGWHIECSAMVREELGDTIDIHLGGADLVFPHHENEIAQSEAATGRELARVWLHNGMVNVGGEKMSKSLGNFTTIRALLDSGVSPMTLRLFVLQAHYRKPLDFTAEALEAAATGWKGLNAALELTNRVTRAAVADREPRPADVQTPAQRASDPAGLSADLAAARARFLAAMDDDFNTAIAMATLFDFVRVVNKFIDQHGLETQKPASELATLDSMLLVMRELTGVLGLFLAAPKAAGGADEGLVAKLMELVIEIRANARKAKDFATADLVRNKLTAAGIVLEDRADGTGWSRK